jgi:DNA-binding IclR family transcriptional regulator
MAGNSTESGRSVTSKITSILMTFTQGSVHSLTEIARLAGLPVSTTHRLTAELASWRLLERTECGHYRVGLPLRMIGAGGVTPPSVAERARGCWTTSRPRPGAGPGWASWPGRRSPTSRSSPATARCRRSARRPCCPAHPLALGRALLAFSSLDAVDAVIAGGLRAYTRHTITAPDRFRRALTVTRLTRVAVTRWEFEPGVSGVAMPVFGPGGDVVAAIELAAADLGRELPSMTAALAVASRSLSRELATEPRRIRAVGQRTLSVR